MAIEDARLRISVGADGSPCVLTVAGEVDIDTVDLLRRALSDALTCGANPSVVVDLTGVTWFTAHGLTALVEARGQARALGKRLRVVVGDNRAVTVPLRATGLDRTVAPFPTLADALDPVAAAAS
ncbi:MAG TPA: STAS domain-containing protein [Sporichthyaceae bacterium]|nr:STAS domain-containing protein [Sporichthyaceae bacterium]